MTTAFPGLKNNARNRPGRSPGKLTEFHEDNRFAGSVASFDTTTMQFAVFHVGEHVGKGEFLADFQFLQKHDIPLVYSGVVDRQPTRLPNVKQQEQGSRGDGQRTSLSTPRRYVFNRYYAF